MSKSTKLLKLKNLNTIKRRYSSDRSYSTALDIFPEVYEESTLNKIEDIVKPYHEIPGPKSLPFIGNSWRFAPFIGKIS